MAADLFVAAGFDKTWASRLTLVVDELFMNAVYYGSKPDQTKVYVEFEYDSKSFTFSIEDEGAGEKKVSPEELFALIERNKKNKDLTRTSGRGLSMITGQWTDKSDIVKSEHGGLKLSFQKSIESKPAPAPDLSAISKKMVPAKSAKPSVQSATGSKEIVLSGEIDQANMKTQIAPVAHQVEMMEEGGVLTLDFSKVTYINSLFIGSLAAWHTHMQHKKGKIVLKNMNPQVKEVLDLVGLLKVVETQ